MNPRIFRKRFIPDELVDISGDEILYNDSNIIVTKWKPIHPRNDFSGGISFAFLNEGYKISRFYDENGELLYWYIDFIEVVKEDDSYILTDLLADIKIYSDGKYEILDEDELETARENGLIDERQYSETRERLVYVKNMIDSKNFPPKFVSDFLKKL